MPPATASSRTRRASPRSVSSSARRYACTVPASGGAEVSAFIPRSCYPGWRYFSPHVRVPFAPARAARAGPEPRDGVPQSGRPRRRGGRVRGPPGVAVRPRRGRADHGQPLARSRRVQGLHAQCRAPGVPRPHRPGAAGGDQAGAPRAPAHLRGGGRVSRRTAAPGGWPPPDRTTLAGQPVDLVGLAADVAELYFEAHPDDLRRYGDLAREWEQHDTQHLLNWAVGDVEGHVDLVKQVSWLAGVLEARDFPLDHLASNLDIAGDVVEGRVAEGPAVAQRLRAAAAHVRATKTFLG